MLTFCFKFGIIVIKKSLFKLNFKIEKENAI